jgi:acetoacetate decarboxylase
MRGKFSVKDENLSYRMPVHFSNWPRTEVALVFSDVISICVNQKTEANKLAEFIPEEFELLSDQLLWQYSDCREVDFMSQGDYRIIQVGAEVRFTKDGETHTGIYPLIIWEDEGYPIIGGREEDGMPKVFANISRPRHVGNHWFAATSLYSETMVRFDFKQGKEAGKEVIADMEEQACVNSFGYRYIPHPHKAGAALQNIILYPQEFHPRKVWEGEGEITIFPPEPFERIVNMALPLHKLASLPKLGFSKGKLTKGWLKLCVSQSKELT